MILTSELARSARLYYQQQRQLRAASVSDEMARDAIWAALSQIVPVVHDTILPATMAAAYYHGVEEKVVLPPGLTAAVEATLLAHEMAHVCSKRADPERWSIYSVVLTAWGFGTNDISFEAASLIYEEERRAEEQGRKIISIMGSGSLTAAFDERAELSLSEYRKMLKL